MGSHVVRVTYAENAVIAHNVLARTSANHVLLKLHSTAWCDSTLSVPGVTCNAPASGGNINATYNYLTNIHPVGVFLNTTGYTEKAIVADNKFIGGDGSSAGAAYGNAYGAGLTPEDFDRDERLRNIIFERNWMIAGTATQIQLLARGADITIRNNIFDGTKALYHQFIRVGAEYGTGTGDPPPVRTHIINNSFYSPGTNDFYGVAFFGNVDDTIVVNNLGFSPNSPVDTRTRMINNDAGSTNLTQSNNSTDPQLRTVPGWMSATPAVPADFALGAGSYARDTGLSSVRVWSDFFEATRPQNGSTDIGAIEGP